MPVYSFVGTEADREALGRQIREHRRRRGWILQDLASRVGVSVATLSAIENRKVSLEVELLLAIAQALDVPLDELLPRSRSCHFWIARQADLDSRPPVPMKLVSRATGTLTSYHNKVRPLAGEFVGKHIEPLEIEVYPVPDDRVQFISHHHEEFVFILDGQVECLLKTPDGLLRETLAAGDGMYFWSYLPHCLRSLGSGAARAIDVLCSPDGPADSELENGASGPIYLMDAFKKDLSQQIVGRIVALRRARGMSTAEFGRLLGVSPRRLTGIERGQKPVTVEFLLELCRTCRKPKEFFLAGSFVRRPFYEVVRAGDVNAHPRRRHRGPTARLDCFAGAIGRPLAPRFLTRQMVPYLLRFDNGDGSDRLLRHPGQEFLYVLRGGIRLLTIQDAQPVTRTLFAGDSCFVEARVPHRFVEARVSPYETRHAEAMAVFWGPRREKSPVRAPAERDLVPHRSRAFRP